MLRIRNVYPGYEFFHSGSGSMVKKITDLGSGSASKNLSIFNPKKLSEIWSGMFIPDLYFLPIPNLGSRGQKSTRSPESESATLCISKFLNQICNCACTASGYWCSTWGTACCMYISRTMNCLANGGSSLKKRIRKYQSIDYPYRLY